MQIPSSLSEPTGLARIIFFCVCVLAIFIAGCSDEGAVEYDADGFDTGADSCDIEPVYEDSIAQLMETHCVFCHSAEKEGAQRLSAPPGVDFDSEALIQRHIDGIRQTVIVDQTMPPGAPLEACQLEAISAYLDDLEAQQCMPTCQGIECGDDGCGGSCGDCSEGLSCQTNIGQCVEGCIADCTDRVCGDDGCGGSCGSCSDGESCDDGGQCGCISDCTDRVCGDDGCGGSCGSCNDPQSCDDGGQCVCVPDCDGRECGGDGCGGRCGDCAGSEVCNSTEGICQDSCTADCTDRICGDDGCDGSCGICADDELCDFGGQCVCAPDCSGKSCGDDGCGGSCGTCSDDEACDAAGQCQCVPDCTDQVCGDDGCGGSCGTCSDGESCDGASCESAPTFSGDIYPIFDATCGGANCHASGSDLDLSASTVAYTSLVDVPSTQCANRLFVAPGSPSTSYLVDKLKGTNMCGGSRMPKSSPLTQAQINLVENWIAAGAIDN